MAFLRNHPVELLAVGALLITVALLGSDLLRFWTPVTALWRRLFGMSRVRFGLFVIGACCFFAGLGGAYLLAFGSPGGEETIVEKDGEGPDDNVPRVLVEILRDTWDAFSEQSNWPAARAMGEVSLAAYLSPVEAEARFKELGYESVSVISNGSLLGYVLTANDSAVIVFRGTDDPGDWVVNLNTRSSETRDGIVHRGFFEAYLKLDNQINSILSETSPKHIWITGHSLGGALAVMCAYELGEKYKMKIDGLITFGQPMVARPMLTSRIEGLLPARYVHFVNERDIVTRIPPGYSHCGELVHYVGDEVRRSKRERLYGAAQSQGMKMTRAPLDEPIEPISEREFATLKREIREEHAQPDFGPNGEMLYKGNSPFIQDHDMATYLERLR
jgi:triacylglycerol lipase